MESSFQCGFTEERVERIARNCGILPECIGIARLVCFACEKGTVAIDEPTCNHWSEDEFLKLKEAREEFYWEVVHKEMEEWLTTE